MLPPKVLVYCMAPIDSSLMLLGTNTGVVHVYDGYDRKLKHQLATNVDHWMQYWQCSSFQRV